MKPTVNVLICYKILLVIYTHTFHIQYIQSFSQNDLICLGYKIIDSFWYKSFPFRFWFFGCCNSWSFFSFRFGFHLTLFDILTLFWSFSFNWSLLAKELLKCHLGVYFASYFDYLINLYFYIYTFLIKYR